MTAQKLSYVDVLLKQKISQSVNLIISDLSSSDPCVKFVSSSTLFVFKDNNQRHDEKNEILMWKTRFELVRKYANCCDELEPLAVEGNLNLSARGESIPTNNSKEIITPNLRTVNGFFLIKTFRSVLKNLF